MKMKSLVAALVLVSAAPVMAATCTKTFSLGSMGPPDFASFGNTFTSAGQFNDCYTFSLSSAADALGVALEFDLSSRLDVDLLTAAIHRTTGELIGLVHDFSSPIFSFDGLGAGQYRLEIGGEVAVDRPAGWTGVVGYGGILSTTSAQVATPVPEADSLAMLAMGLGVVAWASRRKTADKAA